MNSRQDTPLGREILMGEALKVPISRFKREMQGRKACKAAIR